MILRHGYTHAGSAQRSLLRASTDTAIGKLSVDDYGRYAADTILFGSIGYRRLVHTQTSISQEGQAMLLIGGMVSSQAGQPALNTSILRLAPMITTPHPLC